MKRRGEILDLPGGVNPKSIVVESPLTFENGAHSEPVTSGFVLSGAPMTRTWSVLRSRDGTADVVVWECTAGRFECQYHQDEVVMVVAGEVFITDESGQERRLGPGDLGVFHAGTSCIWRVPERVRKIAVLRETMWRPAGLALKIWKRLMRMIGLPAIKSATAEARSRMRSLAGD